MQCLTYMTSLTKDVQGYTQTGSLTLTFCLWKFNVFNLVQCDCIQIDIFISKLKTNKKCPIMKNNFE